MYLALISVFPLALAFAALSDMFTMLISNRVSLLLIAAFVPAALLSGMGWQLVAWHVACGAIVLVVTFALFALGWIGGGDAKLTAAIALWVGFSHILEYSLLASLLGGVLTLTLLGLRLVPMPSPVAKIAWAARLHDASTGIPYGIALATAGIMIFPHTIFVHALTA